MSAASPRVSRRARVSRGIDVTATVVRHLVVHSCGRVGPEARTARRARRLRLVLEDLGATAIKLGQIASTRPDVVGPAYVAELARLQDHAPPEAPGVVDAVITAELGAPPGRVYAAFDPEPIAAASIGEAHAAVRRDGTPVVVKVRRPGVVAQVTIDLDVLERAAAWLSRVSATARRYELVDLVGQMSSTLRAELDYRQEAAHAQRFARELADRDDVHIPRVFTEESTGRVITLERCAGTKPDDLEGLAAAGVDLPALAARCADVMLTMIFEHGFFHADPHAGNFFVAADGTLSIIDFGMVGTLDAELRRSLARILVAVATGSVDDLVDAALALGITTGPLDRAALLADFDGLVATHLAAPLGELRVGDLLVDVMGTMRRHRLRLPVDLALLAKTFAMSEGLAARLDPDFRMAPAVLAHAQGWFAASGGVDGG